MRWDRGERMNDALKAWLSGKTVLTTAEVRKMEPGSRVWIHRCYGKLGEHLFVRATVVQHGKSGKGRRLAYLDADGFSVYEPVRNTDKIAYTLN